MTTSPGTALVTGASSGIGAVYAHRLAQRGHDLILVARDRDRLGEVARRIKADTGRKVDIVVADLMQRADLSRIEILLRTNPGITLLVNNAGIGSSAPLLAADPDRMEQLIAINVTALTRLTYAAVPGFVARGHGTVINIASIVALAPELLNGVYGGSKAFVLALSQSLRNEVADKGVKVQVVLPGATATGLWELAGTPLSNLPSSWVMSAEHMVDASLAGLDQGEFITIPALPDVAAWDALEAARQAIRPGLSLSAPAERYGIAVPA